MGKRVPAGWRFTQSVKVETGWQVFPKRKACQVSKSRNHLAVVSEMGGATEPAWGVREGVRPHLEREIELLLGHQIMFGEGDLASGHDWTFPRGSGPLEGVCLGRFEEISGGSCYRL